MPGTERLIREKTLHTHPKSRALEVSRTLESPVEFLELGGAQLSLQRARSHCSEVRPEQRGFHNHPEVTPTCAAGRAELELPESYAQPAVPPATRLTAMGSL